MTNRMLPVFTWAESYGGVASPTDALMPIVDAAITAARGDMRDESMEYPDAPSRDELIALRAIQHFGFQLQSYLSTADYSPGSVRYIIGEAARAVAVRLTPPPLPVIPEALMQDMAKAVAMEQSVRDSEAAAQAAAA